jgi:hypothetical protein
MFSSPDARRRMSRRAWVGLVSGLAAGAEDELRQLKRAEGTKEDPALASLLARMRALVEKRDYRSLEALMLPVFRVEFDGGKGPAAFRKYWRPAAADSKVWSILERLLSLNGSYYSDTLFAVPYVYTHFPGDLDPLKYVVALSSDVGLLERPEPGARRVASLDHSIIALAKPLEPPVLLAADGFLEVDHPKASACFVAARDVYSPAGHRAFFEKRGGKWRWISFAAATLAEPPDLERLKKQRP